MCLARKSVETYFLIALLSLSLLLFLLLLLLFLTSDVVFHFVAIFNCDRGCTNGDLSRTWVLTFFTKTLIRSQIGHSKYLWRCCCRQCRHNFCHHFQCIYCHQHTFLTLIHSWATILTRSFWASTVAVALVVVLVVIVVVVSGQLPHRGQWPIVPLHTSKALFFLSLFFFPHPPSLL